MYVKSLLHVIRPLKTNTRPSGLWKFVAGSTKVKDTGHGTERERDCCLVQMILHSGIASKKLCACSVLHRARLLLVDAVEFVPDDSLEVFRRVSTGAIPPCAVSNADQLIIHQESG